MVNAINPREDSVKVIDACSGIMLAKISHFDQITTKIVEKEDRWLPAGTKYEVFIPETY